MSQWRRRRLFENHRPVVLTITALDRILWHCGDHAVAQINYHFSLVVSLVSSNINSLQRVQQNDDARDVDVEWPPSIV